MSWSKVDKIFEDLESQIDKKLSKSKLNKLANELLEMVRLRIIEGYGVSKNGGKKKKFRKLEPSTVKSREYKELSPLTNPKTSNQVESGRFVEGLKVTITDDAIVISTSDDRVDIARYNAEKGRPSMYLTDEELDYFMTEFDGLVEEALNKVFK